MMKRHSEWQERMSSRTDLIEAIVHRIAAAEAENPVLFEEGLRSTESVEAMADEMAGPMLRRVLQKQMTDELGPYYTTASLMRRWGVSRQAVSKRHLNGSLLGLTTDDGKLLFPVWQFKPGSDSYPLVIEELAGVREILMERNTDPLSQAIWLTAKVFGHKEAPLPAYRLLINASGAQQVRSAARAEVLRLAEGQVA